MGTAEYDVPPARTVIERQAIELLDADPTIDATTFVSHLDVRHCLGDDESPTGVRHSHWHRCSGRCSFASCWGVGIQTVHTSRPIMSGASASRASPSSSHRD